MSGLRILVAEDDENIKNLIVRYLEKEGFTVLAVSDGERAVDAWFEMPVDLAVLDVMMPKIDGWEVLSEIRKESDIPVIMLTAKREEADRLQGFRLGTDDYMTKPFSPRELVMRVYALLKRSGKLSQNAVVTLPGISLNKLTRSVQTGSGETKLSAREFELLVYFIDNKGIVLSRDRLLERIWGYDFDGDTRVLDTTIKRLRQKLGSCGACIKTLRGTGYMFEVDQ
ncbi:MAG: response regulator transcription factor [Eubacteriales bacterium]|nr:response regulator transcription factor [Eubacteriales bacterium]